MTLVKQQPGGLHPVHIILLGASLPLFLGALLADWAYASTYEVQWINFASWLVPAALIFAGLALLWSAIHLFRSGRARDARALRYPLALLATFVIGFINALVHAKDAWATMPAAVILSVIVFLLALAATWFALAQSRASVSR